MFRDILRSFDNVHSIGSAPMPVTLRDLAKWAETFNDWQNVFYRTETGSVEEKMAFFQMATFAKKFGHWLNVYLEAIALCDKTVEAIALTQLCILAENPTDADPKKKDVLKLLRWQKIFEIVPSRSKAEHTAGQKILEYLAEQKVKNACPPDRTKI